MRKGKTIKPVVKHFDGMTIHGYSVRTSNADERGIDTAKIPALWQKLFSSSFMPHQDIYGVYSDYQSDLNGDYKVTAGVPSEPGSPGLEAACISPGKYLVFENSGSLPEAVITAWQQVWDYFSNNPAYERNYNTDFELYTDQEKVSIYIGVR